MDSHRLESNSFEMGSMCEAQKLCYCILLGNIFYLMGINVCPIFTQIQIQTNLIKYVAKNTILGSDIEKKSPGMGFGISLSQYKY